MADGVETRLREELRRVDVPVRPPLDRVASRATRLRRRRIGATGVVAAILAAGLVLPLATLGRFGTEKQTPADSLRATDLSVEVPNGWSTALVPDEAGDLWLVASTVPIPSDGMEPSDRNWDALLSPTDVVLFVAERTAAIVPSDVDVGQAAHYEDSDFEPIEGPVVLRPEDFGASFDGTPQRGHSLALRNVRISGIPLTVYAIFGDDPASEGLLDEVNGILATLVVTASDEGSPTVVVSGGGMSVRVPAGWHGVFVGPPDTQIPQLLIASKPFDEARMEPWEDLGPNDLALAIYDNSRFMGSPDSPWEKFRPVDEPPPVTGDDFYEPQPPNRASASQLYRLDGRALTIYAEFGSSPAPPDVLRRLNEVLATLEVATGSSGVFGTPPGHGVQGWLPPAFEPADGWYTATTGPMDPDLFSTPLAWAANVPFAEEDLDEARAVGSLGFHPTETLRALPADGVVVVAALSGHAEWPNEPTATVPQGSLPLSLAEADVRGNWEGQVAPNVPQYVLWRTVDGFHLDVRVYFGTQEPTPETLALAQAELARLVLPGPPELRELRIHTDIDDGASIAIPGGWTWHEDPVPNLQSPRILFAAGSWPFPEGGECGPVPALEAMPADGAFLWLLEYDSVNGFEDPERDLPPRPAHFTLDGLEPVIPECSAVEGLEQYILRFRDAGRWFQLQVAFGPEATDERRGQAVAAMDDFEVTAPIPAGCPHDLGPWSDPDCPASTWVRAVVEEAGFRITGDTGSALVVANGDRPAFDIWAFEPDTTQPPWDRGLEQVLTDEGYEWWRGWGTDVYFDGTRVAWFADGLVVYLSAAYDELPPEGDIEAIVRASLRVDYDAIDTRT